MGKIERWLLIEMIRGGNVTIQLEVELETVTV